MKSSIRLIQKVDNSVMENVIRTVFHELDLPKVGTAYADESIKQFYDHYRQFKKDNYYVLEIDEKVVGGSGYGSLNGSDEICELQKLYLLKEYRGLGFGVQLIEKCIESAKKSNYKQMYLESETRLTKALKLYEDFGFKHLKEPIEGTGHSSCNVFMILEL